MSVAEDRGEWRVPRFPYLGKSHPEGSEDSARSIRVRTHRRVYHVKVACSTERVSLMAWCFGGGWGLRRSSGPYGVTTYTHTLTQSPSSERLRKLGRTEG